MRQFFLLTGLLFCFFLQSQDFLGLQSSNYSGVTGAYTNPANIVDGRFIVDVALIGGNINIDNNYFGIKRSALKYSGRITDPKNIKLPASWGDLDPKSPTYFKNNFRVINNGKSKEAYAVGRLVLPSFLITLNKKNAIALNISLRNYINFSGMSQDLADLAYSEFSTDKLLNKRLSNNNLSFQQVAWVEYGLTYARVLKDDNEHFFKAGITPKLLQGLEAIYLNVRKLDYLVSNKDTFSFFNSSVSYGYSDNLDNLSFGSGSGGGKAYQFKPVYGVGLDIGGVYEWRPDYKSYKYDMDGETNLWRRDKNKYRLKASFAILDIGRIKFRKGRWSNEISADVNRFNLDKFKNVRDFPSLDSTARANFSVQSSSEISVLTPLAINAQVDYNIWKPFYVNLMFNITNLQKNRETRVYEYSVISLAPRFDHKWFGVTIPVSYNGMAAQRGNYALLGAMFRLGPLIIGSNDVLNYLSSDVFGASLYAMLKVPIPFGHKRDTDKDGISNKKDKCKTVPGIWEFKGCPDKDGDHVQDSEDKCPDVAGLKELNGCPDKDKDGITDTEDMCPDSAGTAEFKGCPDRDGDKIIDRKDECPDVAGLAEFKGCPDKDVDGTPDKDDPCPEQFGPKELMGCPDKDGDGLADKDDACPDVSGPKEYKGCPDKDGDTVLDKDDDCVEEAGPVDNKGCPWPDTDRDGIIDREDSCVTTPGEIRFKGCPPPMKPAEKKIIEKAFASLEFATGKDVIKPKSLPSLNDLAKLMIKHEAEWTLKLSGHTDDEGEAEANLLLSEKRAKAVKNYLVKKGVKEEQVIAEWFGQTQPIADNATKEGRQKNRRVEMKILYKE